MKHPIRRGLEVCLAFFVRWLWRIFLFAIIFVAVFVSAGREMLPLLEQNKNWLQGHLSAGLGYPVQMETVQGEWEGLIPELRATGLTVGDRVKIDQAYLRVDLLRSAWHRSFVFDALSVDGARIDVEVNAADQESKKINLDILLSFLFGSTNIHLQNVEVILHRIDHPELSIQINQLAVGNYGKEHWLEGSVLVAQALKPIEFRGEFTGDVKRLLMGKGSLYVDFGDGSRIRQVLPFFMDASRSPIQIEDKSRLFGQAWLNWKQNNLSWNTAVEIQQLYIPTLDYRVDYRGTLAGKYNLQDGILDVLTNTPTHEAFAYSAAGTISINSNIYDVPAWGFRYRSSEPLFNGEPALALYVPSLDLASIEKYQSLITLAGLRDALAQLQPKGKVDNIWLTLPIQKNSRFRSITKMNLHEVSVAHWHGAPALAQVDGYLEATPASGFVDVVSQNGFSIYFPNLYDRSMDYHEVQGRVSWQVDQMGRVFVASNGMNLKGDDGVGRAAFWLDLPPKKSGNNAQMYLSVGLKNSTSEDRHKYLPNTLPEHLHKWLNESIEQGNIIDNGFIYRGSLVSSRKLDHTILYYGNLHNVTLNFDPEWPALTNINGRLLVDNEDVHAEIDHAQLNNLNVSSTQVDVDGGAFLTIQSDVNGQGESALDLLRKTPLRKTMGSVFDTWHLHDAVQAKVSLGLPLAKTKKEAFQEVVVSFKHNQLDIDDIKINLKGLSGDLYYSNILGVRASALSMQLWDKPFSLSIEPIQDQNGLPDILVTFNGKILPEQLAQWSRQPFIRFLNGEIPVQGKIEVPLDVTQTFSEEMPPSAIASMAFFTDLQGVSLDLPEPFGKQAEDPRPVTLNVRLFEGAQSYSLQVGADIAASLEASNGQMTHGLVNINQSQDQISMSAQPQTGLLVKGHLQHAILEDWLSVIERYDNYTKSGVSDSGDEKYQDQTSPVFDLLFDQLMIGELSVINTKVNISEQQEQAGNKIETYWNVNFVHPATNGHYKYFNQKNKLPELYFERLDLDAWKALENSQKEEDAFSETGHKVESKDPLAAVVPQNLPALQVETKQVILDGIDIGAWHFDLHPHTWGASLDNLKMEMPGLTIGGVKENEGATVLWRKEGEDMSTQLTSLMRITEKGDANQLIGTDKIFEAKSSELQGILEWDGSPANMQFKNVSGDVSIKSTNGRFLNSNSTTDLMRVINVFNFNTWARRLQLDFTDLYKKGVSYDRLDGHVQLDRGKMIFDKPLIMDSPSSRFALQGRLDSVQNTIDADLAVTLPVGDNATWITALAGGLPAAIGVWAVSKIFKKQIDTLSSVNYTVTGKLDDPTIEFKAIMKDVKKTDTSHKK